MTPPEENPPDLKTSGAPGPVILRDSGLFFTVSSRLPKGIKGRDIEGLVRGLVEEQAPLPIEQTSWGYLADPYRKSSGPILYYAATRQSLFGNKTEAAEDLTPTAILPSFAGLCGLRFSKNTWVFLADGESLSAAFFEAGATIPTRMISRFVSPETEAGEAEREKLRRRLAEEDPEADFFPGMVRIAEAKARGKAVHFQLECRERYGAHWTSWKKTGIDKEARLAAADVRDRDSREEGARVQTSAKRITQVAVVLLLSALALGALEVLQFQRGREAVQLSELAESRQSQVERLQEIESMAQSLEEIFAGNFEPFDWMMAFNAPRPPSIHFNSFALDDAGNIRINGHAPEVKALNDFVTALQRDPRLKQVETGEVETDEDGVRFSLRATIGDLDALPPKRETTEPEAEPETEPEAEAEPETEPETTESGTEAVPAAGPIEGEPA